MAGVQSRVQTVCLVVLTAIAVGAALYSLSSVMVPFVLAMFIALGLTPAIDFLSNRVRLPRHVAILTTLLVSLFLMGALASLVTASVAQLSANADAYAAQLARLADRFAMVLPEEFADLKLEANTRDLLRGPLKTVGTLLLGTTNAIASVLSRSLLVFLFVAFLLVGSRGTPATGIWGEAEASIKRYLVLKAVISAATGLLVGLSLAILGVDLALVFGLFAFLLNFIPSVGSFIATLLPLPVVMMNPDYSWSIAILAIAIPGSFQVLIGNVIEPRVMGTSLDLHPVAILLALMFWGVLWGIVGMLLATPITAVMKMVLEQNEATRPLAALMAGRIDTFRRAVREEPA